MEAIFGFTPKDGKPVIDNKDDFFKFCIENDGIHQLMTIKASAKLSEKQKMFNYLFGPLMDSAVKGFSSAGHSGIDKVKARYILEAEFCKEQIYNPINDKILTRTENLASMSKARLLKFIVDVIFFLELELGQKTPDSEQFKLKLKTGRDYSKVN